MFMNEKIEFRSRKKADQILRGGPQVSREHPERIICEPLFFGHTMWISGILKLS